jgi:hypothetical protein
VALRLLEQQNIPITLNHLIIARAMLKKHLPVSSQVLNEVLGALSAYGPWGSQQADLAVALKAAGLPLNAESLALASRQAAQIGDSLARLIAKLTSMTDQDVSEDLEEKLNSGLKTLSSAVLNVGGETSELAEQLKAATGMLGRSLESILLERSQKPEENSIEKNMLALTQLGQELERTGKKEVADAIADFLKDLQRNHFLNAKPDPDARQAEWSEIGFAIQSTHPEAEQGFSSARLRISRESGNGVNKINPAYTRLILQVDLSPTQTVEVDLSVVGKQIRTTLTAPDASWCQQAQEELPTLEGALQGLGYILQATQIGLGEPQSFEHLAGSGETPLMTVDIEV